MIIKALLKNEHKITENVSLLHNIDLRFCRGIPRHSDRFGHTHSFTQQKSEICKCVPLSMFQDILII